MNDAYGGLDPRDIGNYSASEAARLLGLPVSTVKAWTRGQPGFQAVIRTSDSASLLSFTNLVEVHVLSAIRRVHRLRLPTVRRALDFIEERFGTPHPLAREQFQTDGLDLFLERSFPDRPDVLIAASRGGQLALRDVLIEHLRRIERDEQGIAARLFPFTRPDGSTQPRLVVVDPRVAFGRPVLAGTGIPTDILAERYAAGESVDELAEDYGCDRAAIEEAIRIEARLAA